MIYHIFYNLTEIETNTAKTALLSRDRSIAANLHKTFSNPHQQFYATVQSAAQHDLVTRRPTNGGERVTLSFYTNASDSNLFWAFKTVPELVGC